MFDPDHRPAHQVTGEWVDGRYEYSERGDPRFTEQSEARQEDTLD